MTLETWIDGQAAAAMPLTDRGLHYGDGLFESLPVRQGRVPLLQAHLKRLEEGCGRLGIPWPGLERLQRELALACEGQARAVLKLILTRGSGGRGYRPPLDAEPRRLLLRYPWMEHPAAWQEEGVSLHVCNTRLGSNPALAGLKHLNRLEQVLARAEWGESTALQEGLMLDAGGAVIEGTMTNIFAAADEGSLLTPALDQAGIAGVMRAHIVEAARRAGLRVEVRRLSLAELLANRELFVCNSLIGVWPVKQVAGRSYGVGPLTRQAQAWADAV